MTEQLQYNDVVKSQFPDEWLLVANPEYNGSVIVGGLVLYHSKDKKEVCYIGRDKTSQFSKITLVYTGQINNKRKNGILKRL